MRKEYKWIQFPVPEKTPRENMQLLEESGFNSIGTRYPQNTYGFALVRENIIAYVTNNKINLFGEQRELNEIIDEIGNRLGVTKALEESVS